MRRMFSLEQLKGIADARVQALVEGGTLENAKPIYFHPLTFYTSADGVVISTSTYVMFGSATILNNTEATLAGSLVELYSYVISKFNRLNVSMIIYDKTLEISIHVVQLYFNDTGIYVIGYDSTGTRIDENNNVINLYPVRSSINILDSANKIN